ncbi:hypothetical protein BDN72DRAFT_957429 [Pluteus cervinus]|uniref:Uncharacterized protein n=1 Tax=Pluteus cervinus TaxID=181527 RepID=A0ACD3B328_9AGAR|nr:hypothetical protein BDN72DRAFT_957429 [Pluteus cervinus]
MDLVLQNPLLLERIFSTEDVHYVYNKRQVTVYVFVCKTWSEPALNVLWRNITTSDLPCLLRKLTPLKRMKRSPESATRPFKLAREPTLEDWQRFQRYARRVKAFSYVEPDVSRFFEIDQSVFDSLALIRSHLPIFPNLRTLHIDSSFPNAAMFFHSSIQDLHIILQIELQHNKGDVDPQHNRDFLRYIQLRGADLTSLSISAEHTHMFIDFLEEFIPIRIYEEEVLGLLSQQTRLRHLCLPQFWITTNVVNAISCLHSLETIKSVPGSYIGHPVESVTFYPLFDQNGQKPALPSLQTLKLSVPYTPFHSFLSRWVTPHNHFKSRLQELILHSQILESAETLKTVIECISTCCPGMKTLSFSSLYSTIIYPFTPLHYGPDSSSTIAKSIPPPAEGWSLKTLLPFRVNLATISPLFQLTQLRDLELHHGLPTAFSLSDLEIIATNFRDLTRLEFFSDPGSVILSTSPKIRFDDVITNLEDYVEKHIFDLRTPLRVFGTLCPELRSLGVFLCADPKLTEQQSDSLYHTTPTTSQANEHNTRSATGRLFPNLRSLDLGTSSILGTAAALAGLLCEYVGDGVTISSGRSQSISGSASGHNETYIKRLSLGGKVPDPIPDHTDQEHLEKDEKAKLELWNLDANGKPLGDEFAVVVGEKGEPLSLGLEFVQADESGVKRLPGVYFTRSGDHDEAIFKELSSRHTKWEKVGKMLPLAALISEQEKERVERLKR